jgi:hypothetical protein
MQPQRFAVLLEDGTWDGWRVRWTPIADGERATAVGTSRVESLDIHWDVHVAPSGGRVLERPGGYRIRLSALSPETATNASRRLAEIGDVFAECERARGCFQSAPAVARDLIDIETIYSARACAAVARTLCGAQPH